MALGFKLKPYAVEVIGFGRFAYPARTRCRALADAWRDYTSCYNAATFKDFLRIAKVVRAEPSARFGEPITVAGELAFYVGERGQYIRFVRADSDQILLSHPADVITPPSPPGHIKPDGANRGAKANATGTDHGGAGQ